MSLELRIYKRLNLEVDIFCAWDALPPDPVFTNPPAELKLVRKLYDYPNAIGDGVEVYSGVPTGDSPFNIREGFNVLKDLKCYYYRLFYKVGVEGPWLTQTDLVGTVVTFDDDKYRELLYNMTPLFLSGMEGLSVSHYLDSEIGQRLALFKTRDAGLWADRLVLDVSKAGLDWTFSVKVRGFEVESYVTDDPYSELESLFNDSEYLTAQVFVDGTWKDSYSVSFCGNDNPRSLPALRAKVMAPVLEEMEGWIDYLKFTVDPDEAPASILAAVAKLIGLNLNLEMPVFSQREEIKTAVLLYRRRGRPDAIEDFIEALTSAECVVENWTKNVLVANRVGRRSVSLFNIAWVEYVNWPKYTAGGDYAAVEDLKYSYGMVDYIDNWIVTIKDGAKFMVSGDRYGDLVAEGTVNEPYQITEAGISFVVRDRAGILVSGDQCRVSSVWYKHWPNHKPSEGDFANIEGVRYRCWNTRWPETWEVWIGAAGSFAVIGSVSGLVGGGTVGVPFTSDDGEITFTIVDDAGILKEGHCLRFGWVNDDAIKNMHAIGDGVCYSTAFDLEQEVLLGVGDGVTKRMVGVLEHPPIKRNTLEITAGLLGVRDDGEGNIAGSVDVLGANEIDYASGRYDFTFQSAPLLGTNIDVEFMSAFDDWHNMANLGIYIILNNFVEFLAKYVTKINRKMPELIPADHQAVLLYMTEHCDSCEISEVTHDEIINLVEEGVDEDFEDAGWDVPPT